ncbi:lipoyl synthase, chloroplastic-like protein [Tanacetum coccineum]
MLLKEPNADDPLNEDAADLLLIDRPDYEAKVKDELKEAMSDLRAMDLDILTLDQHLGDTKGGYIFVDPC